MEIFSTFVSELLPLIYAKIWFQFNILRRNGQNFTKFYICIHFDNIYIGIVKHHFFHICTRVMALELYQNLMSWPMCLSSLHAWKNFMICPLQMFFDIFFSKYSFRNSMTNVKQLGPQSGLTKRQA